MKTGHFILSVIVVVFAVYGVIKFGQSIYQIWRLNTMVVAEETALENALVRIEALEIEIERLSNDLEYIEKIAREEYGMIKEDEEVYQLPSSTEEIKESNAEK